MTAVLRFVAAALLLCAAPARAHAQEDAAPADVQTSPQDAPADEARAAFVAGEAAIEAGRWADAIDRFGEAYRLSRSPTALFNRGYSLRALGRYREARDVFARLSNDHSDAPADLLEEAAELRREAAGRVAVLSVTGLNPERRHEMRLDEREVLDTGDRPMEIEADPGGRTLRVTHAGYQPGVWEGRLENGERRSIEIELREIPRSDTSLLENPIFWTVLGAVVLGAAATIVVITLPEDVPRATDRVIPL